MPETFTRELRVTSYESKVICWPHPSIEEHNDRRWCGKTYFSKLSWNLTESRKNEKHKNPKRFEKVVFFRIIFFRRVLQVMGLEWYFSFSYFLCVITTFRLFKVLLNLDFFKFAHVDLVFVNRIWWWSSITSIRPWSAMNNKQKSGSREIRLTGNIFRLF